MRLKTFLTAYLLFIFILFGSLGLVSIYMNNNQMDMLRRQSERDFRRISSALARDFAVLYGGQRDWGDFRGDGFVGAAERLLRGYSHYYREHGISLEIVQRIPPLYDEMSFIQHGDEHFVYIIGGLLGTFDALTLIFRLCITESITAMQSIQRSFLLFSIGFSVVAAVAFFAVLSHVFRPLDVVARTSIKIADGHYGERIFVKGANELSQVAQDFNRMAEKIENQISMLADESDKKQQFIDNFAHEIRTPLTSIYGNAELMQKTLLSEDEIIEISGIIMERTNHMVKIANSLLQLATLRNYSPAKTQINIRTLFNNVEKILLHSLAENSVMMVCKADAETLCGQEDLLQSMFLNLCHNAIKACALSGKSGVIMVDAQKNGNNTRVTVADNGCGIPAKSLARVTEPFYRVDTSRLSGNGVGIGLTLCKQIANVHGAEMRIESEENIGTTVNIEFTNP